MLKSNIGKPGSFKKKKTSTLDFAQVASTLSFVIILLVVGVPLWWKLTEVKRSFFPYNAIEDLSNKNISFLLKIGVVSSDETFSVLENGIPFLCSNLSIFKVQVEKVLINDLKITNVTHLESLERIHPSDAGSLLLVEVPSLLPNEIIMSRHRTMYFSSKTGLDRIYAVLEEVVFVEGEIKETIDTIMSPGSVANNINQLRRVRANNRYDIIFTTVYSEPTMYTLEYDQKWTIDKYFKPFLEHLSSIAEFSVRSHWLFDVNLQVTPEYIKTKSENYFAITYSQIPQIITPLENRLGSGVSKNPCVHFVLYVSKCLDSPVYFTDKNNVKSLATLSARWGGIQIVNPRKQHCNASKVKLKPNSAVIMNIFIDQFRLLFGLHNFTKTVTIAPLLRQALPVCKWELDILYRLKITELFISSKLTLLSLSKLLGEISNIVITEEVSEAVIQAVDDINNVLIHSMEGSTDTALNYSKKSFDRTEYAFTHHSLLALLYFPDDQKYAVYIPLYLPVMIPVFMSFNIVFIVIRRWFYIRSDITEPLVKEESSDEDNNIDVTEDDKKNL